VRPELFADGPISTALLGDILSLVCENLPPGADRWTELERALVADWAAREHLRASDNLVRRRPRPSLLDCTCQAGGS